jgi:hypothetical protein
VAVFENVVEAQSSVVILGLEGVSVEVLSLQLCTPKIAKKHKHRDFSFIMFGC